MAAPTPTPRVAPTAQMLENGHQALVTVAMDTDIEWFEKNPQPFGFDAGDMVDITTQFNTRYRTKAPRNLVETTNGQATVAYDPMVLNSINVVLGRQTVITWRFPNNDTWCAYGIVRSFTPDEGMEDGTQPTATVVYEITNWDHINEVEAAPVFTDGGGT